MAKKKAWGGRFADGTDRFVEEFTASIPFDLLLYRQDIARSIAHGPHAGRQKNIPQARGYPATGRRVLRLCYARLPPRAAGPAGPLFPPPPGVSRDVFARRGTVPGNAPPRERIAPRGGGPGRDTVPPGPRVR